MRVQPLMLGFVARTLQATLLDLLGGERLPPWSSAVNSRHTVRQTDKLPHMYELCESNFTPGVWHVERVIDEEGRVEVAVFSGPNAEQRAREYLDWKNF